jgi:hypothetical protein
MAWSIAGNVITQTGTDANFSGLASISGVTTQTITGTVYPLRIYTLTNRLLKITGTVTLGSREKIIFTGITAQNNILNVDGGTLNIGEAYARNGYTAQLPIEAIVWALTSGGSWDTRVWVVRNAGKFIARNAVFRIPHSIWFEQNGSGQVLLEDCIIDKRGSAGDIQTNHGGTVSNNTTLRRVQIYADGQSGLTFRNPNPPTIESVAVYQARDAWNNESGTLKIVRGLIPNLGNTADVSQSVDCHNAIVNAVAGTQMLWGGHLENAVSNTGQIGVWQEILCFVQTPAGATVNGAIFYLTDTAVAADSTQTALQSPLGGTVNTTLRRTYIASSNASGVVATQTVLIGTGLRTSGGLQFPGGNSNRIRPRGKNTTAVFDATDDIYDYAVWSYAHIGQVNPVTLKGGIGNATVPLSIPAVAVADPNVTLSQTAAAALASIANTDNLYDVAKNWKCTATQANLEYPTIATKPVTANGVALTLGALNFVVDNAAASAFAINTSTNVITIKSASFAVGKKFSSVASTGSITVSSGVSVSSDLVGTVTNAGTLSGAVTGNVINTGTLAGTVTGNVINTGTISNATITGSVSQATPTDLTGVTVTGNLTFNTNTPVTITLTNTTISGTVSNIGTALVTVVLAGTSTAGTAGANVSVQVQCTVTRFGGEAFNFVARYGTTGSYTDLGYQSGITTTTFTVPIGEPVELAMWSLGYLSFVRTIATVGGGFTLAADMIPEPDVDTTLNVSTYLAGITVSNAGGVFTATFNANMSVPGIEATKAVVHRLLGLENAMRALLPPGSATIIEIETDEIQINLPAVFLVLGAGATDVSIAGFFNTAPAKAVDSAYILNPRRVSDNLRVEIPLVKPAIDIAAIAAAVMDSEIETGATLLQSMRLQNAILLGKVSGAGTGTETFRDINDTKNRVVATVDNSGNRTAITKDSS